MEKNTALQIFQKLVDITKDHRVVHGKVPLGFVLAMPNNNVIPVPPEAIPGTPKEAIAAVLAMSRKMGVRYILSAADTRIIDPVSGDPDTVTVTIDGPDLQIVGTIRIMKDIGTARITVETGKSIWGVMEN